MKVGIILFAHGSRDPQWARPFESLATQLSQQFFVRIAYLEQMRPTLDEAVAAAAAAGVSTLRVVPVFLGQGSHVKEDLPRLVKQAAAAHPQLDIRLEQAIGEQPAVIAAIAAAISAAMPR